ncbi:Aquaporin-10 [Armadillidium nasatum]|uniref:Aquaporin-10 n=1 Tax=Armadillidium nasatum TaxID=96803 RepID=A0A5N5TI25_9CRUS|nr:Aquaporin-10 [Armadillidium nasatum]
MYRKALGDGSVAQKTLTGGTSNDFFSVIWGWGLAVTFGVIASGNISGGHINPAVTLAMALWGRLSWQKVPIYMVAQYLGAFSASVFVYAVYISALNSYETTRSLSTAGIWATYPGTMVNANGTVVNNFLTTGNGIGDQIFSTMILLLLICAIVDQKNMQIPKWISPLFVGFAVLSIGICYGFNCGFAINPARDLAPRIFTLIAGWGDAPFKASTVEGVVWWWVPIIAPHIGAVLGMLVYTLFIEMHHEDDSEVITITKENQEMGATGKNIRILLYRAQNIIKTK